MNENPYESPQTSTMGAQQGTLPNVFPWDKYLHNAFRVALIIVASLPLFGYLLLLVVLLVHDWLVKVRAGRELVVANAAIQTATAGNKCMLAPAIRPAGNA